jgi:hypothetical protein
VQASALPLTLLPQGLIVPVEFRAGNVPYCNWEIEYTGDSLEIVEFTAAATQAVCLSRR